MEITLQELLDIQKGVEIQLDFTDLTKQRLFEKMKRNNASEENILEEKMMNCIMEGVQGGLQK